MRKVFVVAFLVVFSINNLKAQKKDIVQYRQNWDKQQIFWGYFLGVNKKDYKISYKTNNAFIVSTPSLGFEVGLIGDLRLHKNISLRLEPGLSSNTKELQFTH